MPRKVWQLVEEMGKGRPALSILGRKRRAGETNVYAFAFPRRMSLSRVCPGCRFACPGLCSRCPYRAQFEPMDIVYPDATNIYLDVPFMGDRIHGIKPRPYRHYPVTLPLCHGCAACRHLSFGYPCEDAGDIVSRLLCPGASARRLRCTARHTIPCRNGGGEAHAGTCREACGGPSPSCGRLCRCPICDSSALSVR